MTQDMFKVLLMLPLSLDTLKKFKFGKFVKKFASASEESSQVQEIAASVVKKWTEMLTSSPLDTPEDVSSEPSPALKRIKLEQQSDAKHSQKSPSTPTATTPVAAASSTAASTAYTATIATNVIRTLPKQQETFSYSNQYQKSNLKKADATSGNKKKKSVSFAPTIQEVRIFEVDEVTNLIQVNCLHYYFNQHRTRSIIKGQEASIIKTLREKRHLSHS